LKLEQWGSPLVQEKYQEENACDKRQPYRIIIIIIIIIITIVVTLKSKKRKKWQIIRTTGNRKGNTF